MANVTTASNVKIIFLNGIGPIIGTIQGDTSDAIVVKNPCQFGLDEAGEMVIRDYLEGLTDPEQTTIFFKYNIVSSSVPSVDIASAYVSAIESLEAEKSKIFVPDNKIII